MIFDFEQTAGMTRERIGIKGVMLSDMVRLGLPVPPGFILTTDAGRMTIENNRLLPEHLWLETLGKIRDIESRTGLGFGNPASPLLVSVRSGASVSMPGMMDTILNIGINEEVAEGLAASTGNEWFAYDCYRRMLQMYSEIVLGADRRLMQQVVRDSMVGTSARTLSEIDGKRMKKLAFSLKAHIAKQLRQSGIPENPEEQLRAAIEAVFASWNKARAVTFRKLYKITTNLGSAVTIQKMVYGNFNAMSATGIMTTRDPTTGDKKVYGEYLPLAQGEDVLSGSRVPLPLREMPLSLPAVYEELLRAGDMLEKNYRDMQEVEFTVESGKLYMLQTREPRRTAAASIKVAVDLVKENVITKEEAIFRVKVDTLDQMLHQSIEPGAQVSSIARGLPASPGAASGPVVFDVEAAEIKAKEGILAILVRPETTTEDVRGLAAAAGVLTCRGGRTSHAAVVARGMGKPCVAGCEAITINADAREFSVGDITIKEGDIITIDGSTGSVFIGTAPMRQSQIKDEFRELLGWCDEVRTLKIRANCDSPDDAARAVKFGAEGIGLCRTEQMFQAADRLPVMRAMIIAHTERERRDLLQQLSIMQQQDFISIFQAMDGRPVTFRLLDVPLHEFLTPLDTLLMEVALLRGQGAHGREMEAKEELLTKVLQLTETNPMLGLRGCRLGILFPEINEMQLTAIFEAACQVARAGTPVKPEIMVPLVGHVNELKRVRDQVDATARRVMSKNEMKISYKFGALIEIPRAALTAERLAPYCDFFSFGTNDLTQTTFGFSRDDAERKFLLHYLDQNILEDNPFDTIDLEGVGRLVRIAVEDGRRVNQTLELGLCGEHGGEIKTIDYCHDLSFDYVSCSAYRVPAARLAAAQVKISKRKS